MQALEPFRGARRVSRQFACTRRFLLMWSVILSGAEGKIAKWFSRRIPQSNKLCFQVWGIPPRWSEWHIYSVAWQKTSNKKGLANANPTDCRKSQIVKSREQNLTMNKKASFNKGGGAPLAAWRRIYQMTLYIIKNLRQNGNVSAIKSSVNPLRDWQLLCKRSLVCRKFNMWQSKTYNTVFNKLKGRVSALNYLRKNQIILQKLLTFW